MDPARATSSPNEQELLEAARRRDEDAFGWLVRDYGAELQAHCYRMLGSVPDAEDALQETLLSAWRGLDRFEGRSSLRSWLYKIATNACLKLIERRPKRVLPLDYGPAADPEDGPGEPVVESVWIDPYPDRAPDVADRLAAPEPSYEQRESVELAFIAALQHLPPRQRAVLILRDVLGFSGSEVAEALDTTPASIYSALQRAHEAVEGRLPDQSQQATLRSLGDRQLREIVDGFVAAWERNDVDRIAELLVEDAVMAMPPLPTWYRGREAVAVFLRGWPLSGRMNSRVVPTRANGQLAFGEYRWDADRRAFLPHAIMVLTLAGERVKEITAFLTPGAFERFGLPAEIER